MSRSSTTVSSRSKLKIVFLGDQSTGKTSVIDRYINNTFNPSQDVNLVLFRPLLVSISWEKMWDIKTANIDYNFGIQLDKRDSEAWFQITFEMPTVLFLFLI